MSGGVKGQGGICGEGENKAVVMAVVTRGWHLDCIILTSAVTRVPSYLVV